MSLKRIVSCLVLLFGVFHMNAQSVVINEYSASNLNGFVDDFGKTEDYIELYNTTSSSIDIGGWHLSDKEAKPMKYIIPSGTVIPANGFMLFLCSGRDTIGTEYIHTNFKLSQTAGSDLVLLSDENGTIQEQHNLHLTFVEASNCRESDGSGTWKICPEATIGVSNNSVNKVNGYTAEPTIEQEPGFYANAIQVSIVNNEPNSELRYTTNGNNVTENDQLYSGPFTISNTSVVKARSFSSDSNLLPGKMDFGTFFINEGDFSVAVFSVASDDIITLANDADGMGGTIKPIGSIEYFDAQGRLVTTSFGDLNRHGQDSWALPHRSLDWVSRDEMGYSKAVNAPIFSYSDRTEYQRFMFRASGDDNYPAVNDQAHQGATHIRDEYVHQLSLNGKMEVDVRAIERVVLFLNGEYWGLYGMRERPVDHDYTKEYYDQDKYKLQYLTTWGDTEAEYGGDQALYDWEEIRNYVLENDMSLDQNYTHVDSQYNYLSLIDYMLVNLNTVARDWLNYNTGWWRGLDPEGKHKKWGYIIWDMDATFDYYINYTDVPNTSPTAEPCDIEHISDYMDQFFGPLSTLSDGIVLSTDSTYMDCPSMTNGQSPHPFNDPGVIETMETQFSWQGWNFDGSVCCDDWNDECETVYGWLSGGNQGNVGAHEKVWLKLIEESPTFAQLYYSRHADIMNTVYSCENMMTTLDSMLATINPEMDRQIARWGGSRTEWEQNVETLKEFIEDRCELIDDGPVNCYDLEGPYEVTLRTEPDLVGEIDFNTLDIRTFPWTGEYYGGMDNLIKARVFDEYLEDYEFSHWESANGNTIFPSEMDFRASIVFTEADTLTAVFSLLSNTSELETDLDLKLFPNPANQYVNVDYNLPESAYVRFELQTTMGQTVRSFQSLNKSRSAGKYSHAIPLNDIPSGMYLLQISVDDQVVTKKISCIKQ